MAGRLPGRGWGVARIGLKKERPPPGKESGLQEQRRHERMERTRKCQGR